ncbi:hypothetical protein D3OALGB2SA_5411 [Olavius algarvensis associated proteobacterium Delta 3]|nr:hypothetical protein D3OALGB2SA_5411 [Olavius algarvensis associated proteobacterium Delta 3]
MTDLEPKESRFTRPWRRRRRPGFTRLWRRRRRPGLACLHRFNGSSENPTAPDNTSENETITPWALLSNTSVEEPCRAAPPTDVWDGHPLRPVEGRTRPNEKSPSHQELPDTGNESEEEKKEKAYILCRQCRQPVTRPDDRISVQGSHTHTFANPHGIVFEITCFRSVTGCGYAGPATDEFSWFGGYRWRIIICATCLTHLGWLFTSAGQDSFAGLILDRLIQPL